MLRNEAGSGTGTPLNTSIRPVISRTPSTNTTVLRDLTGGTASPRPGKAPARAGERRRLSSLPITSTTTRSPEPEAEPAPSPPRSPSPGTADSDSTHSSDSSPGQSRIIRRPPRYQQADAGPSYDDDEDDESEPAFQPYKPSSNQTSAQDLGSTLRGDGRSSSKRYTRSLGKQIHQSQTSDSSASSAAMVQKPTKSKHRDQRTPGPLSPRRVTELDGRSPGTKSRGSPREGSDGTPSMGSSFSDLDGKLCMVMRFYVC